MSKGYFKCLYFSIFKLFAKLFEEGETPPARSHPIDSSVHQQKRLSQCSSIFFEAYLLGLEAITDYMMSLWGMMIGSGGVC